MEFFARIAELCEEGVEAVLVTVVSTSGSTPRKAGARMAFTRDGRTYGTIGGGSVEHRLKEAAYQVLRTQEPLLIEHALTTELGMCCGGKMTFFVEPLVSAPPLLVLGCGHVGAAIIHVATAAGFALTGVDDLPEHLEHPRLAALPRRVDSYDPEALEQLPWGPNTFVVIATREHQLDQRLLEFALRRPTRYLGVIGSKRKAHLQLERLRAKGFSEDQLAAIHCPIGLDIRAETPEEIAVAVVAELIAVRRGAPRAPSLSSATRR